MFNLLADSEVRCVAVMKRVAAAGDCLFSSKLQCRSTCSVVSLSRWEKNLTIITFAFFWVEKIMTNLPRSEVHPWPPQWHSDLFSVISDSSWPWEVFRKGPQPILSRGTGYSAGWNDATRRWPIINRNCRIGHESIRLEPGGSQKWISQQVSGQSLLSPPGVENKSIKPRNLAWTVPHYSTSRSER